LKIKCIIFDLGGVLVELDFSRFFNEVITPSPLNKPQTSIILEFFRQSDTYHQGLISNEEFYHQACELLQICSLSQKEFYNAFNSIVSKINEEMVNLIRKIRQKNSLKTICLSNINASHWNYLKEKGWNLSELFDDFILSHEVHLTKPDPKIFKLAIHKAKCKPNEIIFIDDGLNNIRSAREMGINAIKFVDVNDLIEKLREMGISI